GGSRRGRPAAFGTGRSQCGGKVNRQAGTRVAVSKRNLTNQPFMAFSDLVSAYRRDQFFFGAKAKAFGTSSVMIVIKKAKFDYRG
ncbi:MAG TPA: hypothetical protein DIS96_11820, partial [Pusillimonas sp.]|nr:hypothetical protein [Pusillimonas sp.]